MRPLNPKKLHHSKWTAMKSQRKERHFIITEVEFDEERNVQRCVLQAVMTKREEEIDWRNLKDPTRWMQGWK